MSEKTDPVMKDALNNIEANSQQDIDLMELAELIVKLIQKEIELESLRTGKY